MKNVGVVLSAKGITELGPLSALSTKNAIGSMFNCSSAVAVGPYLKMDVNVGHGNSKTTEVLIPHDYVSAIDSLADLRAFGIE